MGDSDSPTHVQQPPPDYRVVLLGASNLTLGLPRLVRGLQEHLPGKLDILAAHGHGRSYLNWSRVLHRELPAIRDCRLWDDWEARPAAQQTFAIVTDLGCDLFYGQRPEAIVSGVEECLDRLQSRGARVVLARPPLERLARLPGWQYVVIKNLFFPGHTPPWPMMREWIETVDTEITARATQREIALLSPPGHWYGWDPIHVTARHRNRAWEQILAGWNLPHAIQIPTPGNRESLQIWTKRPALRRLTGRSQQGAQPAWSTQNGDVTLSIY